MLLYALSTRTMSLCTMSMFHVRRGYRMTWRSPKMTNNPQMILPLFWDPRLGLSATHLPRFYPAIPSRLCGCCSPRQRHSLPEAGPTFVLVFHQRLRAGDEIVLDGLRRSAAT